MLRPSLRARRLKWIGVVIVLAASTPLLTGWGYGSW